MNNFVFLHKYDLNPVYCDFKILVILRANINKCYGHNIFFLFDIFCGSRVFEKTRLTYSNYFPGNAEF